MRELTSHKVNPANDKLKIEATDEPGSGGAHHRYEITGFDTSVNPSSKDAAGYVSSYSRHILLFQNGPIAEVGVNGITHEALLAILIDRMECFQAGPYANDDNRIALSHMLAAQNALHARTLKRMERGVEGTHKV